MTTTHLDELQTAPSQSGQEPDPRPFSRKALLITILATSLGFVLVQLDVSIVNVALAQIGTDLRTGVTGLQWVVDAYTLLFASLLLFAGTLADRIGARKAFVSGFGLFVAASLACGLAPIPTVLIVARCIQGIGAAFLVPCSLALLNHACRDDIATRARAVGLWTAAGSVALATGPVLGGFLVHALSWRSIFFVNLPLGAIGIWLTWRYVEESPAHQSDRFDLGGQLLAIAGLSSLTATMIETSVVGWSSPLVLLGFGIALICVVAFVLVEARVRTPMLPLNFFRNPTFSATTLVGLAINLTLYGVIFILSLYLQQVRHFSPIDFGIAFLPFPLVLLASNLASSWLGGKFGMRPLMVMGLLVASAGYWLLHKLDPTTPYVAMLPGLLVIPLGIGLAVPAMTTALLSAVPRSRSGIASGVLNTVRQAGGAIGVALFGSLIAQDAVHGVSIVFVASAAVIVAATMIAVFGIRPPKLDKAGTQ
ncbi:MFS transporter [Ktedonobacter sp. SOSP1-52]|uniref:MFS transporter n=1 Tax=Ktedonobacter sp. SOSP1-52 TaxID=2778366 RepID=UPI001916B507|nr:MFS transporter [Ktedonobacter sp. SOSP1-52]GHO71664.1 MFS transporter [Ktedonobacter sp. SOSP1-52]